MSLIVISYNLRGKNTMREKRKKENKKQTRGKKKKNNSCIKICEHRQ